MKMRLSLLSDVELEITQDSGGLAREVYSSPSLGFAVIGNASGTVDDLGLAPHTGTIAAQPANFTPTLTPALQFLLPRYPKTTPLPPLKPEDEKELVPYTHTTGGENRSYCSAALRYALAPSAAAQQRGLADLLQFNAAQLLRPLFHALPFAAKTDLTINKGTPNAWTTDQKTPAGFNAWDAAHSDLNEEFALAALGHPLGLINVALVYRIYAKAHKANTSYWQNQKRAACWALLSCIYAHYAGIGSAPDGAFIHQFCDDVKPRELLRAYAMRVCDLGPVVAEPADWFGNLDDRVMTVIPGGSEIKADYAWQEWMLIYALAETLRSGLLLPEEADRVRKAIEWRVDRVMAMAMDARGMAWAYGTTRMSEAAAIQLLKDVNAYDQQHGNLKRSPYEVALMMTDGTAIVRKVPAHQDVELAATAYAGAIEQGAMFSVDPKNATFWLASMLRMCYGPSSSKYPARYLEPAYAALERLTGSAIP